jgi:DNA ligase (NAD+)
MGFPFRQLAKDRRSLHQVLVHELLDGCLPQPFDDIRLVGERVAQLLAARFGSLDRLVGASADELAEVHGVGAEIARSVAAYFGDATNRALAERLAAAGIVTGEKDIGDHPRPLAGKIFVLTGTLPTLTREEARDLISRLGGRVTGSVSRKTDYVVAGDAPGSKVDDARRLGVAILDEPGLLAMTKQSGALYSTRRTR